MQITYFRIQSCYTNPETLSTTKISSKVRDNTKRKKNKALSSRLQGSTSDSYISQTSKLSSRCRIRTSFFKMKPRGSVFHTTRSTQGMNLMLSLSFHHHWNPNSEAEMCSVVDRVSGKMYFWHISNIYCIYISSIFSMLNLFLTFSLVYSNYDIVFV